ncbi:MAG: Gfo/Idh/MocA family oxidoreductase [Bacteroidetes bacterium]|nr:Gfo/Idh/MocA family oxidoreductase [Bacteroidota bacterium]
MKKKTNKHTRREFVKTSLAGMAGAFVLPTIVPSNVFGKNAPSNKINIAQIGCGRIARSHDIPETIKFDDTRFVAVCDVDRIRLVEGKQLIENWYAERKGRKYIDVNMYEDFRELVKDPGIDAVIISTPDHWHAQPAIEAALAGKDIYLQKPASLTVAEGRLMSDIVHRTGSIFQIGSQQRSMPQFRLACELVRNGRIGEIKTIKIGLPGDPAGEEEPKMAVPENLNYDMWLGSTPVVYYTEKRVHPQLDYSRPGWLRCEQFGAGMITGWGAHHLDIAHWGMGTEYSGPVEIEAEATFPEKGLWNVHGEFKVQAKYANGVKMYVTGNNPNGVRFEGSDGWIFVTRGNYAVTSSDPVSHEQNKKALDAGDPGILTSIPGSDEVHLYKSEDHHGNWIDCIKNRKQPIAPAEVAHRSCSACLISHIAMKLPGKLFFDPKKERFIDNDEANSMLSRPQRYPYGI